MQVTLVIKNSDIKIASEDLNIIKQIISLKKRGLYFNKGRTCYFKLIKPVFIDNIKYSYVKIKGCGAIDENNHFIVPGQKEFEREDPHFGMLNIS